MGCFCWYRMNAREGACIALAYAHSVPAQADRPNVRENSAFQRTCHDPHNSADVISEKSGMDIVCEISLITVDRTLKLTKLYVFMLCKPTNHTFSVTIDISTTSHQRVRHDAPACSIPQAAMTHAPSYSALDRRNAPTT
jgi:hypothetical protein